MPEFWELSDEEIWSLIDGDWLMRQFRRSEESEGRERKQIIQSHGNHGMGWNAIAEAFRQAAINMAAYLEEVGRQFHQLNIGITQRELQAMIDELTDPPPRCARSQSQQHTIRTAFQRQTKLTRNTRPQLRPHRTQHR